MPDTPTTDDPAAETTSERIAVSEEDGRPLSELTDEELEIEATDLRSAVETITLDLLDDAKGDFWRSDDWRKRARAALGYKRADLRVCNLLLKQRQETRISKPAKPQLTKRQAREAKAQIHEATLRAELERKAHRRTMSDKQTTDEWADLGLYDRCLAEGLKARDDWRTVRSDCPYPANTAASSAWMDGYDAANG